MRYRVCLAGDGSGWISDRQRDQAIFTAGYFESTEPDDADDLHLFCFWMMHNGARDSAYDLRVHGEQLQSRAWAEVFAHGVTAVGLGHDGYDRLGCADRGPLRASR